MTKKLKVFHGRFDGTNREMVATATKKEAAELFGFSLHTLNQYASITGNKDDIAVALTKPGTVFIKHRNGVAWHEKTRRV